ncbi:MAG: PAS domain S-box protein, partial [Deltaproteobacteria bacterium]|nr:PAS domain S-box protein [Deltaproteobacteria bacterium]
MNYNQGKFQVSGTKNFFRAVLPVLLLTLIIGGAGYLVFYFQKQATKESVHKQLTTVADLKVSQIVLWRSERKGDAVAAGKHSFLSTAVGRWLQDGIPLDETRSKIAQQLTTLQQVYGYHNIFIIDTKRTVRLSLRPEREAVGDISLGLAKEILEGGGIVFSPFQRMKSRVNEIIYLDILAPLVVADGGRDRIVGVILLRINPSLFLYPLIQSWPVPSDTAETLLVTRQGEEVVFLNELRFRKNAALNLRYPIRDEQILAAKAALGVEGTVEGLDYRRVPVLGTLRKIPDSPWFVITKIDKSEAYSAIREKAVLIIGVTLVLIITVTLWVLARWRHESLTALRRIEWLMTKDVNADEYSRELESSYGDMSELNTSRVLLDAVGKDILFETVSDYVRLLDTSAAVYERNGDYALSLVTSGWCRLLDQTSRRLGDPPDNVSALKSERWHCHESCWTEASKVCIETGQPVDIECRGGIRIYAVPIWAGKEIVGAINFGYGDPPRDPKKLNDISGRYGIGMDELDSMAREYETRPPFIISAAKDRLISSSKLIGAMVERKRVEELLRESETTLQSLIDNSPVSMAIITQDTRIEYVNRKFVDVLGYTLDDVPTIEHLWFFVSPDKEYRRIAKKLWLERLEKATMDKTEMAGVEVLVTCRDGSIRNMIFQLSSVHKQNLLVLHDITDIRRAETAVKKIDDELKTIFDSVPATIWYKDTKNNFIRVNKQAAAFLGMQIEDIEGKPARELFPEHTDIYYMDDLEVINSGKPKLGILEEARNSSGEIRFIKTDKLPFINDEGKLIGII